MKLADVHPYAWAALALAAGVWWLTRKGQAQAAGAAVGAAVVDAGAGVVLGIGDAIGIPRTNASECQRAIDDGRWWDASKACPAGDYIEAGAGAIWDRLWGTNTGSVSGSW